MARTRALLRCGQVAGPLFVGTFLVEGVTRPSYEPVRHPVSSLALGPQGWVQTANFMTAGVLYVAFATGLQRAPRAAVATDAGPILIGAAAVGLIGAAVFVTDPVSGYPPGTPDAAAAYTSHGALHDLFSAPTFLGIPAASLASARASWTAGDHKWAAYSAGSALAMLASVALASAGFNQVPHLVDVGGLLQRVSAESDSAGSPPSPFAHVAACNRRRPRTEGRRCHVEGLSTGTPASAAWRNTRWSGDPSPFARSPGQPGCRAVVDANRSDSAPGRVGVGFVGWALPPGAGRRP